MNGWLIALICVSGVLLAAWSIFALIAASEGRDAGRRKYSGAYYEPYDNDFWRPWGWVYDAAYIKHSNKEHITTAQRNRRRVEAKLAKLEGKPSPKVKESEFEDA